MSRLSEWLDNVAEKFEVPEKEILHRLRIYEEAAWKEQNPSLLANILQLSRNLELPYRCVRSVLFELLEKNQVRRLSIRGRFVWATMSEDVEED